MTDIDDDFDVLCDSHVQITMSAFIVPIIHPVRLILGLNRFNSSCILL
jgi:hypothetical protein